MSAQGNQPQSGSGAGDYDDWASSPQYGPEDWDDFGDVHDEYYDDHHDDEEDCYYQGTDEWPEESNHTFAAGHTYGSDLRPGEKFNHKTAPSFDGSMSWFMFCEVVKDWEEVTVVDKKQRGPHLRNRLSGAAALYKRAFDRDKLCQLDGVEYFLKLLKREYIRDAPRVFMWRFTAFLKIRRGGDDILTWLYKYDLEFKRLEGAWKDLSPHLDYLLNNAVDHLKVDRFLATRIAEADLPGAEDRKTRYDLYNEHFVDVEHMKKFPFQELVKTLFFVIQSQLNPD